MFTSLDLTLSMLVDIHYSILDCTVWNRHNSIRGQAMKIRHIFYFCIPWLAMLLSVVSLGVTNSQAADDVISSRTAEVEGVKLHYLTAGNGPAVILLHGYTQTSRMWRPLSPRLTGKFTVIAPDLPGIGDSEIPANGLDMKTAAIRLHALAKSLGN
jgi:hypothetical protein